MAKPDREEGGGLVTRTLGVGILVFLGRDEIERPLVLGEGGDSVEVVGFVGHVVRQQQTKRLVGSEAEPQGLFFVLARVRRVGDENVVLGDLLRCNIRIEIPHLVGHVREA